MFSASQVATFELCERKWGWQYLEGLRATPHPSAELGTAIHAYLQESVETRYWNTADPAWPLVAPARKFLQSIPDDAETEGYFELELGPHKFRGYKDVQWLRAGIPCVVDHKSTGSFTHAKEPEDLKRDVQATLYALDAMQRYYQGEPGPVDLVWSYYRTRDAPLTKLTKLRVYHADIEPRINKTLQTANKMQAAIDAGKRAGDMTPDWDACHAYGGCPFREHCEQEEIAKGTGINVNEKRKALLDMLNSKLSGAAPAALEVAGPPPPPAEAAAINPPDDDAPAGAERSPAPACFAAAAAMLEAEGVAPPQPEQPAAPAPRGQVKRRKVTLYVDCLPVSGAKQPMNASVLYEKARVQLDTAHYKLLEFGKGPGAFSAALRNVIEEDALPDGVYLSTATGEGKDALETLSSYCDVIIRGLG